MEVNPSNRSKVMMRINQHKDKLSEGERNLKRAMTAMSNSAAARDELFAYDGTSDDSVWFSPR